MSFDVFRLSLDQKLWGEALVVFTDGACRGNPGEASFGAAFYNTDKKLLLKVAHCIGKTTNNVAEYTGVLESLKLCCEVPSVQNVTLFSDSEFLVKQLKGEYKVKAPHIKPLFKQCCQLALKLSTCQFVHIPREKNATADGLANEALDRAGH